MSRHPAPPGPFRTPRYRVPFPDLTIEPLTAPCSDRIVAFTSAPAPLPPDAATFAVGNLHKSGAQLITPGMIANGELKYMAGGKF